MAIRATLLAAATAVFLAAPAAAELPAATLAEVDRLVDADTPRLTAIFKDIHQHPELGFTETRTAAIMARELKAAGFTVTTGIGKTGVVGVLANGPGKTLWVRADMDANGVKEATGLAWAATAPQKQADGSDVDVMHACGHDAHVTWAIGMAKAMAAMKGAWTGTLVVYGQPAEELGMGARAMVADRLLERGFPKPDFGFGVHTAPLPVGMVSNTKGVRMAGVDQLDVTFTGVGGHGSTPQMAIDPVVMAANAVLQYQTIVSRTNDPQSPAVLTVGSVQAGRDNNVIPQTALLRLNLRWLDPKVREMMLNRIDTINRGIVLGAGLAEDQVPRRVMKGASGPLSNDEGLITRLQPSLTALLGEKNIITNMPTVMGSEDFQDVMDAAKVPYAFLLVGVADPPRFAAAAKAGKPFPYSNHNPDFVVDLAAIPVGAKVDTVAALTLLAR